MEHGGMLDVCTDVYRLTGKTEHLALMRCFDRAWFRQMLASGDDQLGQNGEHSNTELAVVVGLANQYSLTQDATYRQAVLNFLDWMQTGHEFCTGGVSGKSAYPSPLGLQQRAVQHAQAAGPADQQHTRPPRAGKWGELLRAQPAEGDAVRTAVDGRHEVGRRIREALRPTASSHSRTRRRPCCSTTSISSRGRRRGSATRRIHSGQLTVLRPPVIHISPSALFPQHLTLPCVLYCVGAATAREWRRLQG